MVTKPKVELAPLSSRVLYRRGEAVLYRAARIHFRGRRGALRGMVRRYLKRIGGTARSWSRSLIRSPAR